MCFHKSSMEDLLVVIVADILSRLPIKTILHSRCVCKTWRSLVSDSYFAKLHLSRSPTSFMIQHESEGTTWLRDHDHPGFLTIVQVEDETNRHNFRHDPLMSLDLTLGFAFRKSQLLLVGSVNGWLCLWQNDRENGNTLICNPLTPEYTILPRQEYYRQSHKIIVYGFGFSLSTWQHKVVRIFQGNILADETSGNRPSLLEAEVYTLGTGKWRSLGHVRYWLSGFEAWFAFKPKSSRRFLNGSVEDEEATIEHSGPFLNGSVHWFVIDKDSPEEICSFDMETKSFQLFPSPPKEDNLLPEWNQFRCLGVLRGCLCTCDTVESGLDIWVMKEYGIKKSWTKNIVIRINIPAVPDWFIREPSYAIKGLKDGTILFTYEKISVFSYSRERKTVEDFRSLTHSVNAIDYVPSFLRLGNYELENVHVF